MVVGEAVGFSKIKNALEKMDGVTLVGRVNDDDLVDVYAKARGFLALAKDEDFGITPVEAMASGTPVIAYNGGGFRESVDDGKTGILVNDTGEESLRIAIEQFNKMKWHRDNLILQSKKFSRGIFERRLRNIINSLYENK